MFEENGRAVAQTAKEYPVYYPVLGWAEQNPEDCRRAVCSCIQEFFSNSEITAAEIAEIGIDGQFWSAAAMARDGKVLTNTPIWMDTCADDICQKWSEQMGEKLFQCSGNPVKPIRYHA